MGDIEKLEGKFGISLPTEYRQFLLEVGHGAGPYYGLWSPQQIASEIGSLCEEMAAELNTVASPSLPFPLTEQDTLRLLDRVRLQEDDPYVTGTWPSSGCLPICYHGCTFWSVLVVQGEYRGRIWAVASYVAYEGLWVSGDRPPGVVGIPTTTDLPSLSKPPTFLEWYQAWLDRCFADLQGPKGT